MVKFEITATPEESTPLLNRVVCDVFESKRNDPAIGLMANWRGSVKDEYFSILFLRGILVVSVEERECNLGHNSVKLAMSKQLFEAVQGMDGENAVERTEKTFDYFTQGYSKEIEEICFADVMEVLGWQCAENVKTDFDMLSD